jgi:hypothetical protein
LDEKRKTHPCLAHRFFGRPRFFNLRDRKGQVQPRSRAQRSNVGCNPLLGDSVRASYSLSSIWHLSFKRYIDTVTASPEPKVKKYVQLMLGKGHLAIR